MTQAIEQKLSDNLRIMRAMLKSAVHTLLAPLNHHHRHQVRIAPPSMGSLQGSCWN